MLRSRGGHLTCPLFHKALPSWFYAAYPQYKVLLPVKTLCSLVMTFGLTLVVRAVEPNVRVLSDIAYLGADRAEKLDVYLPAPRATGVCLPALVWIHGGGFAGGAKNEARAIEICSTLAHHGYVAVSIDYGLHDAAWPQQLLDCKNAVRFLRANAVRYQVDPERIAVAGGSAGGFLALMVGFTADETALEPAAPYPDFPDAVRCVIDMYGPVTVRVLEANVPSKAARDVSVLDHLKKNSPPVLILQGRADPVADYRQSQKLAQALQASGAEHEMVLLDGVGHTFDWETWQKKPLPRDLRPVALAFLAKHLGAPRDD